MMNDVDALWISPWRKLQKSLASGLGEAQGRGLEVCQPMRRPSNVIPAGSWLIRARNRKEQVLSIMQ
jgi:hypothetical protein